MVYARDILMCCLGNCYITVTMVCLCGHKEGEMTRDLCLKIICLVVESVFYKVCAGHN